MNPSLQILICSMYRYFKFEILSWPDAVVIECLNDVQEKKNLK